MARGNIATLTPFSGKWKSGATQTIRVPIALADSVLEFARKLDNEIHSSQVNESTNTLSDNARSTIVGSTELSDSEINHLSQVIEILEEVYKVPRNNFGKAAKAKLMTAIDELKSLVTSE